MEPLDQILQIEGKLADVLVWPRNLDHSWRGTRDPWRDDAVPLQA